MNISLQDALSHSIPQPFELNQRVTHAQYGAGTIRGFVWHGDGSRLWLVQFDFLLLPELAALSVSELYAAPTETLTPLAP